MLVTNPHADKSWTPIQIFKVFTPSVKYNGPKEDGCYQYGKKKSTAGVENYI